VKVDAPADRLLPDIRRQAWPHAPAGAMLWDASRLGEQAGPACLDPRSYDGQAAPVQSGGRQAAWVVSGSGWEGVLRGYRRGGLVGRLNRESYLWEGENRTRPFREFRLLAALREQGLRVPAPLAAAYWRHGLSYRAAILVERIPDVRPLAEALDLASPGEVAAAIVRLHRAGAWHADLNAYNILIDADRRAWLIDFDRGTSGGLGGRHRQGNLLRLRRSLRKVAGEAGEACWQRIAAAYRDLWMAGR
jgi:3-deoxy-D-manno-octulosonic acid kinase